LAEVTLEFLEVWQNIENGDRLAVCREEFHRPRRAIKRKIPQSLVNPDQVAFVATHKQGKSHGDFYAVTFTLRKFIDLHRTKNMPSQH
jgi:hypothetical protein